MAETRKSSKPKPVGVSELGRLQWMAESGEKNLRVRGGIVPEWF